MRCRQPSRHSVVARELARIALDLRTRLGWSQRDLAGRAGTSQATVWRLESGEADHLDLDVVRSIFEALGGRLDVTVQQPFFDDGRRGDAGHARMASYSSGRLREDGWRVSQEVEIRRGRAIGWIDIFAYRPRDRACLMTELKTDLLDIGGAQRQVDWHARASWAAARSLGWVPSTVTPILLLLDTARNAEVLESNVALLRDAFPIRAPALLAGIRGEASLPTAPALALVDPLGRRGRWLRATPSDGRRTPPAYADYAGFMSAVRARRRALARPRR